MKISNKKQELRVCNKNIILFISLFLFITICKGNEDKIRDSLTVQSENQRKKLKRYDVKSGIVTYKITTSGKILGSTITGSGTEKLFFKNWGAVELIEENSTKTTNTKIFGKKSTETTNTHTMRKLDNGESYYVDFNRKVIHLRRDMAMDLSSMFHPKSDAGDVGENMLEGIGGEKTGTEIFMGYNCEVWNVNGAKQWMYKGVPLKIIVTVMGIETVKEAVKADFNMEIPNDNFKLPNYALQKEEGFLNNEEFEDEIESMDANMDKMSEMSFEEWKELVIMDDKEMQEMSDEELRQTYHMMQKMIQARKGKR